MKKILIVEDAFDIRELLELIISAEFDNPIVVASCGIDAIELLKKDIDIGLILSDFNMPSGSGKDLFDYNSTSVNLPFILMTGDEEASISLKSLMLESNPLNSIISKPWKEDELLLSIQSIFDSTHGLEIEVGEQVEYKKVKVQDVLRFLAFEFKYYIKQNDFEYIPISQCHTDISKFVKENRDANVYLSSNDFELFVKRSIKHLSNKVRSINSLRDFFKLSGEVVNLLANSSHKLNIEIEDLVKINAFAVKEFEALSSKKDFKEKVESIISSQGYLAGHSLILIQVAARILKEMGFFEEAILSKIIQASFLHDLYLEDDNLSSIVSIDSEKFKSLPGNEQQKVLSHPVLIASQLEKSDEYAVDVINMVKLHHIKPTGDGFPEVYKGKQFSLTSAIFIVSHLISDILFKEGYTDKSLKNISNILESEFNTKEFQNITLSLKSILS